MKFLVFQHVRSEDPGSFIDGMKAGGHEMVQVELDEGEKIPPLDGFDALLVMGGPQDVWETDKYPWLVEEMDAIGAWVRAGKPYLGICLGNQLLAMATGGHAQKMAGAAEVGVVEVDLADDVIFAGVARPATCFEWHGAEVVKLPPGAKVLGRSAQCAVQGIRVGEVAYGLQFHPELTPEVGLKWGALPAYQAALETLRGAGALAAVRAEVEAVYPRIRAVADGVFGNFLRMAAGRRA